MHSDFAANTHLTNFNLNLSDSAAYGIKISFKILGVECNYIIYSSTQFSPSYFLLGHSTLISLFQESHPSSLETDRRTAFLNSQRNFEVNKYRFEKPRKEHIFHSGDMVYGKNGNKLNLKKLDPVRIDLHNINILQQISNVLSTR